MDAAGRRDDPFVDLDRAVDVLVEKDIEVAVGLAYSALVLGDPGLAARCASSGSPRRDEGPTRALGAAG